MTTLSDKAAVTHSVTLDTKPLTETVPTRFKGAGRPRKLIMPDLPKMEFTATEQEMFDYFLDAYHAEYSDMTPTDELILHLAAVTYIKYLRLIAEEIKTGKLVTQSRQHPGIELRGLLDQLSFTRKARITNKRDSSSEEEQELRQFFMSLSQNGKKA